MPARHATIETVTLATLRDAVVPTRGYLDAATCGLPLRATVAAMQTGLAEWAAGTFSVPAYDEAVTASRAAFGRIVGVPSSQVSVGSQAAPLVGLVAANLPDGAEVLTVAGDFTSVTYPFLAHRNRGVVVRAVPVEALADEVRPGTSLVAFSLVQSADGRIADLDAVTAAARAVGALTLADLTQAAGWLPVDAGRFDVTVTSAYKWLGAPRGVAFATVAPHLLDRLRPINASWYAGADVWSSTYGHDMRLADDARRFDVSPAWLCWPGAVPSLEAFADELAGPDPDAIRRHDVALADALLAGLGLPARGSAIVSLPDPDGCVRASLTAAGLRVAGRAGGVRLAFHVWNDDEDVSRALTALTPAGALTALTPAGALTGSARTA
jgi:selenocysteine lyase/cysteine desulfurase